MKDRNNISIYRKSIRTMRMKFSAYIQTGEKKKLWENQLTVNKPLPITNFWFGVTVWLDLIRYFESMYSDNYLFIRCCVCYMQRANGCIITNDKSRKWFWFGIFVRSACFDELSPAIMISGSYFHDIYFDYTCVYTNYWRRTRLWNG